MSAAIEVSQRDLATAAPLAPATKTARHACIVQILSRERIRSQAQLRKALALRGISTTQATLSRDLVELRATKIRAPGGELIYSMPEAGIPCPHTRLLAWPGGAPSCSSPLSGPDPSLCCELRPEPLSCSPEPSTTP